MKRDMNLARAILLKLEEQGVNEVLAPGDIQGVSEEEVSYHIKLLAQAELVELIDGGAASDIYFFACSLTWQGHEFLDAARDDTRWEKAKKTALEKGGAMTFELLKAILIRLMSEAVFGKPG